MTGDAGDAREEAERIVHDLTASAFNGGRSHALGDMEGRRRWQVEEQGECDAVVAVLAAAIDWCNVTAKGDASIEEIVHVGDGIAEAVSALRARAGEETG